MATSARVSADSLDGTDRYDAVVFGATPAGVVASIRLAREGHTVLLVSAFDRIGGMLTNGLSMIDALYEGRRTPLYDELMARVRDYYIRQDGTEAESVRFTSFAVPPDWKKRPRFESRVMQIVLDEWIAGEQNVRIIRRYEVAAVDVESGTIESAQFRSMVDGGTRTASARLFMDCSYEGDLLARAGVPYVVGREGRNEFSEPHAGKIFVAPPGRSGVDEQARGTSSLLSIGNSPQPIGPESTGAADGAVQAYNIRFVLSSDPKNRRPIERPANYDREFFRALAESRGPSNLAFQAIPLMNGKAASPAFADFVGHSRQYPEADWREREQIIREHVEYGLGLLYFLQSDDSVSEDLRREMVSFGLPGDEFVDNGNVPSEVYVREARRMRGRYVFSEEDATIAPGTGRTPIHPDSIALSEWVIDSHACTPEQNAEGLLDGELFLSQTTMPSQVPFSALLPEDVDNLIVPVCLSATHVGFSTLRIEPVFMHVAEAAAWAGVLALHQNLPLRDISVTRLQTVLVQQGAILTFFDDDAMSMTEPWMAAAQYLGTKGFFPDYRVRPHEFLDAETATLWAEALRSGVSDRRSCMTLTRRLCDTSRRVPQGPISLAEFLRQLAPEKGLETVEGLAAELALNPTDAIRRKEACLIAFRAAIERDG